MTRRQKITTLLKGYLEDISTVNGYLTNAGVSVFHWATQIVPRDDADGLWINLKDGENTHETGGHIETLNITVELGCKAASTYTTITNMVQDVQKCFEDNLATLAAALSTSGMRWFAVNETIDITKEKEFEIGKGTIEMQLQHKFGEKWELDETVY